jgi:hypothetical protein
MHNITARIYSCGPGGRKCSCCNPFHGKSKNKMNRIIRRRLAVENRKEVHAELSSKD